VRRRQRFTPLPTPAVVTDELNPLRVSGFSALLGGLFFLLIARLWLLQIVRGDAFHEEAAENRSRVVRTIAPRGIIVDAKGRLLVTNGTQFSVYLHLDQMPRSAKRPKAKVKGEPPPPDPVTEAYKDRVAQLVEITRAELDKTIVAKQGAISEPIPIRDNIDRHLMARLYERQDDLQGISVEVVPVRKYPVASHATHILGYTALVSADDLKNKDLEDYPDEKRYRGGDYIGRAGVEKSYDELLRGTSGMESFEVDARGRRRKEVAREPAQAGATLTLTVDQTIQEAAEKALGGRAGAVVAVDPRDGRVLAMVSAPTYDLSWRTQRFSDDDYTKFVAPGEMNRAMRPFPPGSTFKIITSAAGLGEGKIGDGTYYTCSGVLPIGKGKPKKCDAVHGTIGLTDALAHSCDIFYYHVGMNLGVEKMALWARRFGLDHASGIDLPGEMGGIIPDAEWKAHWAASVNKKKGWHESPMWFPGDSANTAIGQGFVTATPLQMALVASAIANGGTVFEPRVVAKATAPNDPKDVLYQLTPKVHSELKLTPEQIDRIRRGMRACVTSGTGRSAEVGCGIRVYGKTGSAEKQSGKDKGANYGWFTCYGLHEGQPSEIAVCVMLEPVKGQNFHGGEVAAPVARQVIEAYYFKAKK